MKTILYFLITITWFACNQPVNKATVNPYLNPDRSNACLSQVDAEKILGQTAKLQESSSESKNGILEYRCTFTADLADPKTNKLGNLYYLLQEYEDEADSRKAYAGILEENEILPGLEKIDGIGNQAFIHSDHENFIMIIARKNNNILRLKVNKLTSMTSLIALQQVSKNMAEALE